MKLFPPFVRSYLSGAAGAIGPTLAARSINDGLTGGYSPAPFQIPDDFDPDVASTISVLLSPLVAPSATGQVVHLELYVTRAPPGGTQSTWNITQDWPLPDPWPITTQSEVIVDAGAGATFPPGTFAPGDWVGMRLVRVGAHANDTFTQGLLIADTVIFEYTPTT